MYTGSKHLLMYTKLLQQNKTCYIAVDNFVYVNKHLLPLYIPKETVIIAVDKFVNAIYMYNIATDNFVNGNK